MQSHSVAIHPTDSRCHYWAKIVRAGKTLPAPSLIKGANDIHSPCLELGEEELLPGDALFEGESNHHHRDDHGWSHWLTFVNESGKPEVYASRFNSQKAEMKAQGLPPELLHGNGDVAAMVRIVHGLRAGLSVTRSKTE